MEGERSCPLLLPPARTRDEARSGKSRPGGRRIAVFFGSFRKRSLLPGSRAASARCIVPSSPSGRQVKEGNGMHQESLWLEWPGRPEAKSNTII